MDQVKAYLRATGACQDMDRTKFETVKGLRMVEDGELNQHEYLLQERVHPHRRLFAVQEHARK